MPKTHNPTCDVCEMQQATLYCDADEAYLCLECDTTIHGANTLASRHRRVTLQGGDSEPHPQVTEDDGVCPGGQTNFHHLDSIPVKPSTLEFPLGGIRIGDITYARVSHAVATSVTPVNLHPVRKEEEEAHQVPRFVPVAQELPSLEPFRFHALATSGGPPVRSTRFMSLLEGSVEAEPERGEEDVIHEASQELGVVPEVPSVHTVGETGAGGVQPAKGPKADKEREARVNRYREKRRTRMFSKKIRYEVRKIYAENRPRLKGRFVRRTNEMDLLPCTVWSENK